MEFYATASSDVRQSIISQADPEGVRKFCQLDRKSRELCRNRLTPEQKYKACLDKDGSAQECDLIPMFSQQQFLSVIPKNIEIYPQDERQLTHEFYSQQYKLPTDGFAVALRKAKIMNTICAVVRPDFLLNPRSQSLPLPSYIDATLLDWVVSSYKKTFASGSQDEYFGILIDLLDKDNRGRIEITINYRNEGNGPELTDASVTVKESYPAKSKLVLEAVTTDKFLDYLTRLQIPAGNFYVFPLSEFAGRLNAFRLSRFVKIAMDLGYFYKPQITIINSVAYAPARLI